MDAENSKVLFFGVKAFGSAGALKERSGMDSYVAVPEKLYSFTFEDAEQCQQFSGDLRVCFHEAGMQVPVDDLPLSANLPERTKSDELQRSPSHEDSPRRRTNLLDEGALLNVTTIPETKGWLWKRGQGFFDGENKRWFILQGTPPYTLRYSTAPGIRGVNKGSFEINGHTEVRIGATDPTHLTIEFEDRTVKCRAEDAPTAQLWKEAIQTAISNQREMDRWEHRTVGYDWLNQRSRAETL